MPVTRAKFICTAVEKRVGWGGNPFHYAAKFNAVGGNSEENKRFFASSPNGTLEISVVSEEAAKVFEPGKSYYLDFTPAVG